MYKITMVDDDGNPQLWTCGSNCTISGISPFFQKKDYLLVPDSYTEMFKQYNPHQCIAARAVPGYKNFEQLTDLHDASASEVGAFISAQVTYLGSLAVARYFPLETPNDFVEETLYNVAAMARAAIRLSVERGRSIGSMMATLPLALATKLVADRAASTMGLLHGACCQCGEEWECFETYAGFWHSIFSIWNEVEGGCLTIEHLDDTNELEVSNPKAIQATMLELIRNSGIAEKVVPIIFELSENDIA